MTFAARLTAAQTALLAREGARAAAKPEVYGTDYTAYISAGGSVIVIFTYKGAEEAYWVDAKGGRRDYSITDAKAMRRSGERQAIKL